MIRMDKEVKAETLEWQENSLCADPFWSSQADWFSVKQRDQEKAKRICEQCPAQQACLDYAIKYKEEFGIWGGLLPRERYNYIRRMQRANRKVA